jgi:putative SOS response-associated peptidase YedK
MTADLEGGPMCGRFTISVEPGELAEVLGVETIPDVRKRYNVAPTQTILAARVNDAGKREAALFHWGLIPSWSEDAKIQYSTINAKSETAAHKPPFRSAFKRRRCIIPADGFFERAKALSFKKAVGDNRYVLAKHAAMRIHSELTRSRR